MPDEDVRDEAARFAAQRANDRVTEHVAQCAVQYDRIDRHFSENTKQHDKLQNTLDTKLVSRDRYNAVERIVWGIAGAMGLAVVAAVMAMVLK